MQDRKFGVLCEWNYRGSPEEQFEHCCISPSSKEAEEYDGDNCISGTGYDEYRFDIYPSLKEAIANAGFNPFAIDFFDLTNEEKNFKDDFLAKCTWTSKDGLKISE